MRIAGKGASKAEYKKISKDSVRYEMSMISTKARNAVVPETVRIGGKTYKVTSVAPNAFDGVSNLKDVTLGKHVKKIGAKAFNHCKNLKTLTIKSKGLTKKNVMGSLKGSSVNMVRVPDGKEDSYKNIFKMKNSGRKTKVQAK